MAYAVSLVRLLGRADPLVYMAPAHAGGLWQPPHSAWPKEISQSRFIGTVAVHSQSKWSRPKTLTSLTEKAPAD